MVLVAEVQRSLAQLSAPKLQNSKLPHSDERALLVSNLAFELGIEEYVLKFVPSMVPLLILPVPISARS